MQLAGGWCVQAHAAPCPVEGWCVLELSRPAATLDALTADEATAMGLHIRAISAAIRAVTDCERVYVIGFAEAHKQVHLHLVPRHAHHAATTSWALADHYRAVAQGRDAGSAPELCEKSFAQICAKLLG